MIGGFIPGGDKGLEKFVIDIAQGRKLTADDKDAVTVLGSDLARKLNVNVGDTVKTTSSTYMYTGPGSNYLSVTNLTSNKTGPVLDHSLRGIYAKGYYWWKCTINGYTKYSRTWW